MREEAGLRVREAFEDMSASVVAPPDLADRVRRAARRRRQLRLRAAVAAACAVAVAAAVVAAVSSGLRAVPKRIHPSEGRSLNIPVAQVDLEAVGGSYIYVATGDAPYASLSVYSRLGGRIIRTIGVPALPSSLNVGPGGTVWITFYPDQNPGGSGVWLLSADLSRRSSPTDHMASEIGLNDVLPTGPDTAVVQVRGRLDELRLPAPGARGSATLRPVTTAPYSQTWTAMEAFAPLAGRIAVEEASDAQGTRLVLSGSRGAVYKPRGFDVGQIAAEGGGLWVVAVPPEATSRPVGRIVLLGANLQVETPPAIAADADLRSATGLFVAGDTVWVGTSSTTRPLVCFRYSARSGAGPVTTVPVSASEGAFGIAGGRLYLLGIPPFNGATTSITSQPVPRACR